MNPCLLTAAETLAACISSGRVVRIGEAALVGRARIVLDERRMDLATIFEIPASSAPLSLWLCHYPGQVPYVAIRDALERGFRRYAELHGVGVPSHLPIFPGHPILPDFAVSATTSPRHHAISLGVSLPDNHLALIFYLVEALEQAVAALGIPPRRIRRIRRLSTSLPAHGHGPVTPVLPSWVANLLRRTPSSRGPKAFVGGPLQRGSGMAAAVDAQAETLNQLAQDTRRWRRLLMAETSAPPVGSPRGFRRRNDSKLFERKVVKIARRSPASGVLDLPSTIARSALREASSPRPARTLAVLNDDLVYGEKARNVDVDRCLLLDASASMAGERTKACYAMADYFLRHSHGRLALVTFRGDKAEVLSGFTRSRRQLLQAMQGVKPSGLTPLASGLLLSLELVNRARARRPQVILVTDGEPTRSLWTHSALQDSLRAAELFRRSGIALVCCGLAGNESTLAEITRLSAGRLYVLRDFSERSLLFVTRRMLG